MNLEKLVQKISADFYKDILTDKDKTLLNLVFADNPTQEDLEKCLENYDIEVVGAHKALLLSYFMKMHPELKFPEYIAPRLKGLIQFYRFQNMNLIAHYKKICNELKKNNIEFLIFKGGCMKYLRPEFSRIMGDIDILVHKKDFQKCGEVAEKMGYDLYWDIHSIDLHPKGSEEGIMDIHKYIILQSDKEKAFIPDLFKRASKQNVFGVETLVPCNEDLVFIALLNMVRNLRNNTSIDGIPYILFDCRFLIDAKPDFDWNIVMQNIKKTKTENHIYFAVKFLNNIVPGLLPEQIQKDKRFEKEFEKYCILLIYQRFFLWEMKQKSHTMKIKDLFSSLKFFSEYLKLKPKYFILKLDIIKKNPYIAGFILKKAYKYEN